MARRLTLLGANAPAVLDVPLIREALSSASPPARNTIFRWITRGTANGELSPLTRGLYLNNLARPLPTPADAAFRIRRGAIVSLHTVLGDAGVLNNYTDVVTCVVPYLTTARPSVRSVKGNNFEFQFYAMPARLLDERAGALEDIRDLGYDYDRATPEKALLDWMYLGASPRARLAQLPLDIDLKRLDLKALRRIARSMGIVDLLRRYLSDKRRYDQDSGVRTNGALSGGFAP